MRTVLFIYTFLFEPNSGFNPNPGRGTFAVPHDSSYGMPTWFNWVALAIAAFIVIGVYRSIEKDKNLTPEERRRKKLPTIFKH